MLNTKDFYFVRHGETDHNKYNIADEHSEIPLNETGIEQAHSIKEIVQKLDIRTVCFSPYKRAVHTKDIIIQNLQVKQVEILELSECTAKQWSDMVNINHDVHPPHVQSFMQQSLIGINKALEQEGPILVVAHGGIHYALCHHMQVEHEWNIGNCIPVHFSFQNCWNAKIL